MMMMMPATTMKCKKHPYEQGVGVCASCLRERLLDLIAAQSGRPQHCCAAAAAVHHQPQLQHQCSSGNLHQQLPAPLVFPRSVSPYVSRRRSVDLDFPADADPDSRRCRRQRLRFFSTPQVGPAGPSRRRVAGGGFLSSLFGGGPHHSRSEEVEPEFVASGASHGRSSSWFSSLLPGGRKKKQQQQKKKISRFFEEVDAAEEDRARRRALRLDRRVPPPVEEYDGAEDDSASESGYSTESSAGWRIPAPTPMRKHLSSAQKTMSGFVVCLSPLVRPSPRRSQPAEGGGAAGISGELHGSRTSSLSRHHHHHHHRTVSAVGGLPALAPNRSRKLADLGRFR